MAAMSGGDAKEFRLGLLLAGGGAKARRALAGTGNDLERELASSGVGRATIEAAHRLAVAEARTVVEQVRAVLAALG